MTTPSGPLFAFQDIVFPCQANHHGKLFAGHALQSMAKAAFLVGRSVAQRDVVMASVTGIDFVSPVPVGHVLTLQARVSRVGRSSMTVCVTGLAQALGGPQQEVLRGVFEMVAVDAAGRPAPIPRSDAALPNDPLPYAKEIA
ncbi:acyl-CoA thioesterase [Acidovorax sp. SUPP1855]|uniref:acyl-CoA thioesterase n=1 Tax=Acidovorax sp. SUPP1855 TaxID=431774 RepID=UPI0023DE1ECD|nr:hotdog domain-containing protein [Acidovorax sp. SUPP1855]GKS84727.1 acyl-CoA thioesterase [Acidovorax sp. SUPP1855]